MYVCATFVLFYIFFYYYFWFNMVESCGALPGCALAQLGFLCMTLLIAVNLHFWEVSWLGLCVQNLMH